LAGVGATTPSLYTNEGFARAELAAGWQLRDREDDWLRNRQPLLLPADGSIEQPERTSPSRRKKNSRSTNFICSSIGSHRKCAATTLRMSAGSGRHEGRAGPRGDEART